MATFGHRNLEDDVLFEELWKAWINFPWLQSCQARSSLHSQFALKHCGIWVAGEMEAVGEHLETSAVFLSALEYAASPLGVK